MREEKKELLLCLQPGELFYNWEFCKKKWIERKRKRDKKRKK